MINIAIAVLWFLIGLILLAGVVYLAIFVIEKFIYPIPERVKQGVWIIVLLLALIALLTAIVGGGSPRFPSLRGGGESDRTVAAVSTEAPRYLSGLLTKGG